MTHQKEILIIEDDKSLTFLYQQLLKAQGFSCHVANDGEQALHYLDHHQPDIILLDMHVPFISGVEILRHIKNVPHAQNTAVFIVSADEALTQLWADSVEQVFIKPFKLTKLVQAIKEYKHTNPPSLINAG